jgi:hypothetical protein
MPYSRAPTVSREAANFLPVWWNCTWNSSWSCLRIHTKRCLNYQRWHNRIARPNADRRHYISSANEWGRALWIPNKEGGIQKGWFSKVEVGLGHVVLTWPSYLVLCAALALFYACRAMLWRYDKSLLWHKYNLCHIYKSVFMSCLPKWGPWNIISCFFIYSWHKKYIILSMRDPQGSAVIWLQVVGPGLAHKPKQEGVQQLLHRIRVE